MSKDKKKSLDQIANGFRAAHKINTIRSNSLQTDTRSSVMKAEPDVLKEILQVLAEYSPEKYKNNLSRSLDQSSLYADTYRNLRHHLSESSNSRSNKSDDLIGAMRIVKPAVKGKNQHMIEKILRIYEILREE